MICIVAICKLLLPQGKEYFSFGWKLVYDTYLEKILSPVFSFHQTQVSCRGFRCTSGGTMWGLTATNYFFFPAVNSTLVPTHFIIPWMALSQHTPRSGFSILSGPAYKMCNMWLNFIHLQLPVSVYASCLFSSALYFYCCLWLIARFGHG